MLKQGSILAPISSHTLPSLSDSLTCRKNSGSSTEAEFPKTKTGLSIKALRLVVCSCVLLTTHWAAGVMNKQCWCTQNAIPLSALGDEKQTHPWCMMWRIPHEEAGSELWGNASGQRSALIIRYAKSQKKNCRDERARERKQTHPSPSKMNKRKWCYTACLSWIALFITEVIERNSQ